MYFCMNCTPFYYSTVPYVLYVYLGARNRTRKIHPFSLRANVLSPIPHIVAGPPSTLHQFDYKQVKDDKRSLAGIRG